LEQPNIKTELTNNSKYSDVIKVIKLEEMELYSDIISQRAVCMKKKTDEEVSEEK
jgi:hypothetical protein